MDELLEHSEALVRVMAVLGVAVLARAAQTPWQAHASHTHGRRLAASVLLSIALSRAV
jgi:hypothetical protein